MEINIRLEKTEDYREVENLERLPSGLLGALCAESIPHQPRLYPRAGLLDGA